MVVDTIMAESVLAYDCKTQSQESELPSSNFAEDYKGKEVRTRQCMNYGEDASATTIAVDVGHLFKKILVL